MAPRNAEHILMTDHEALRFLVSLGLEYAQWHADNKRPMVQQALLHRIEAAAMALRPDVESPADGAGQD